MIVAVGFENFSGGMGTAAFVALLMALCDHRFTATQYALLSALASFGRVYVGPAAGYATDPRCLGLGWATFFFLTFVVALPGLALLYCEPRAIEPPDRRPRHAPQRFPPRQLARARHQTAARGARRRDRPDRRPRGLPRM